MAQVRPAPRSREALFTGVSRFVTATGSSSFPAGETFILRAFCPERRQCTNRFIHGGVPARASVSGTALTAAFPRKIGDCEFSCICGGSRARAFAHTGDALGSDPLCLYQPIKVEVAAKSGTTIALPGPKSRRS